MSTTSKVGTIARLKIKADKIADFEKAFLGLVEQVNAKEEGCLFYQLFKNPDDETEYTVLEQYASEEAVQAHVKSDHFRAVQRDLGAAIDGAPEIIRLKHVG